MVDIDLDSLTVSASFETLDDLIYFLFGMFVFLSDDYESEDV